MKELKSVYVTRNFTCENLFSRSDWVYSGYSELAILDKSFESYIWMMQILPTADNELKLSFIASLSYQLRLYINSFGTEVAVKNIYLFTLIDVWATNWFDISDNRVYQAINEYNEEIFSLTREYKNIKCFDLHNWYSREKAVNFKYYYTSLELINPFYYEQFKNWFQNRCRIIFTQRKKCIVLDLDNTLWGGIIGEDELRGIKLGDTYPGRSFQDFQRAILNAKKHGVILAIVSKNNESDAIDVFNKHEGMILSLEDISAYRINWVNKASNIQSIALELNIGLDSMVFIDDNPAEREIVKRILPEVVVPEFPLKPFKLLEFFKDFYNSYFSVYGLTNEDLNKTAQYKSNTQRKLEECKFSDVVDYYRSLKMNLIFSSNPSGRLARLSQMTQKTNQFNLTTIRRTEEDLIKLSNDPNYRIYWMSVSDKFGDSGITLMSIVHLGQTKAKIDSFLLSCRVLGRGIENAFLKLIINDLYLKGCSKEVLASYVKSKRNQQTENFYQKNHFDLVESNESVTKYKLKVTEVLEIEDYYKIDTNGK
jgi:FkbH-like protein